jgi:hypothetical protein
MTSHIRRGARVGLVAAVFATGYLCGSLGGVAAEAQVGDLGKKAMEQAGESGGALGGAAKLGNTITDLQKNVTDLQKNIDTLNEIKKLIGG